MDGIASAGSTPLVVAEGGWTMADGAPLGAAGVLRARRELCPADEIDDRLILALDEAEAHLLQGGAIDDGTMPGGFGTSPFDGEGVPTRRTVVIENGVLKSYLLNSYSARKLGLQTTANASRGLAGTPGIGPGNYFLQPGTKTPQAIIAGIPEGLYVTEFLGHGVNLVTGDYSRGASGLWISGGELAYPVEEITVAGNLKEIFFNISEIGNDLEFRGAVACPTIRIDGLTVGGE